MQAVAFLRTFDAGPDRSLLQSGQGTGVGTIEPRRRYVYKILISLQSHLATEANRDFSFVTAVLGVFSTSLPTGRLGSREAVDWCAAVSEARLGSEFHLLRSEAGAYLRPAPQAMCLQQVQQTIAPVTMACNSRLRYQRANTRPAACKPIALARRAAWLSVVETLADAISMATVVA